MAVPKTFTGGERLFAEDLNGNFEALDTRLATAEFDITQAADNLDADNLNSGTVPSARFPDGSILKAQSATLGADSTITSQSYTDTGMTISYTPVRADSRLYVEANVIFQLTGAARERAWSEYLLLNESTGIRTVGVLTETDGNNGVKYLYGTALLFVDEVSGSTDARTYKVQVKNNFSSQSIVSKLGSTITVYEVAA